MQRWEIFSLWQQTDDDIDREFVQFCELVTESGEKAMVAEIVFKVVAQTHRNTISVMGLPINPGRYELLLYLANKGQEKERLHLATYPLLVTPAPE